MRWISIATAALLVFSVGCSGKKTEVTGEGGKKMSLTAPGDTNIKQGETAKITVKVKREKFDDPIDLTFSDLPEGVKVEEATTRIDKDKNSAEFTLKADAKAPLKEGNVAKVTASAAGMKATEDFKINVKEKK